MKYTAALLFASAAVASAQVVYNETTNTFTCPASAPNGAFCAGNSQETNIIIRCNNGVGQPGNCNNNLVGRPPLGVGFSACFQTSPSAGDAACSKNCIIYYDDKDPVTIPGCIPSVPTDTATVPPTTTTTYVHPTANTTTLLTSTIYPNTTTIVRPSLTITPLPSGSGGIPPPHQNGTITTSLSPTRTPVGPTTTSTGTPPQFTGAADRNSVGVFAGVLGLAAVLMI